MFLVISLKLLKQQMMTASSDVIVSSENKTADPKHHKISPNASHPPSAPVVPPTEDDDDQDDENDASEVPQTDSPLNPLNEEPVVPPTDASMPVVPPTDAPVVPPTDDDDDDHDDGDETDASKVPQTDAPVNAPTDAPVVPPTDALVVPPTGDDHDDGDGDETDASDVTQTDAPVNAPTDAPVVPPTDALVVPPTGDDHDDHDDDDETDAPPVSPTDVPVVPPTGDDDGDGDDDKTDASKVPQTDAPVNAPTDAPVVPPTNALVVPPTGDDHDDGDGDETDASDVTQTDAPVNAPTAAPVVPPTDALVVPPTGDDHDDHDNDDETDAPPVSPTDVPVFPPTGDDDGDGDDDETDASNVPQTDATVNAPTDAPVVPSPDAPVPVAPPTDTPLVAPSDVAANPPTTHAPAVPPTDAPPLDPPTDPYTMPSRTKDEFESINGRKNLKNHKLPCLLCNRVNELVRQFLIKEPSEDHAEKASWIHSGAHGYAAPLWYRNWSTSKLFDIVPSRTTSYHFDKVHDSMCQDFEGDDQPSSLSWYVGSQDSLANQDSHATEGGHSVDTQTTKVISYSIYKDDLDIFPLYWLGLKLNIDAVKLWFPGWKIQLYAEKSLTERPFFESIIQYAQSKNVPLNVVYCKEASHPMLERYRPLVEQESGICVVRDIDSILSLTDAKLIEAWLNDSGSHVLAYKEYKMGYTAAGGGVAVKLDKVQRKDKDCKPIELDTVIGKTRGRGLDEWRLEKWILKVTNGEHIAEVQVRMTLEGIYCLDFYRGDPKIVWSNSFFHKWLGKAPYKFNGLSETECEEKCLLLVKEISPGLHLNSHRRENRHQLFGKEGDEPTWAR